MESSSPPRSGFRFPRLSCFGLFSSTSFPLEIQASMLECRFPTLMERYGTTLFETAEKTDLPAS
jgi:hypothetical protein